jgi:hypothetical protein
MQTREYGRIYERRNPSDPLELMTKRAFCSEKPKIKIAVVISPERRTEHFTVGWLHINCGNMKKKSINRNGNRIVAYYKMFKETQYKEDYEKDAVYSRIRFTITELSHKKLDMFGTVGYRSQKKGTMT